MAADRSFCLQIKDFPSNRHSVDEERTTPEVGGVHFQAVWVLRTGCVNIID